MTSLQVRIVVCDTEGCPEEYIPPIQYSDGVVPVDVLMSSARRAGWESTPYGDICPLHVGER